MSSNGSCWNTSRDFMTGAECMVVFAQELRLVGETRSRIVVLQARWDILSFQTHTHLSLETHRRLVCCHPQKKTHWCESQSGDSRNVLKCGKSLGDYRLFGLCSGPPRC